MSIRTLELPGYDETGENVTIRTKVLAFDNLAIRYDPIPVSEGKALKAWTVFHVKSNRAVIVRSLDEHEDIIDTAIAIDPLFNNMPALDTPEYDIWFSGISERLFYWLGRLDAWIH